MMDCDEEKKRDAMRNDGTRSVIMRFLDSLQYAVGHEERALER